jgi:hypothetical protein
MAKMTLQQKSTKGHISREQFNPNNKPEVNSTFQLRIDTIRSAADDLEKVEGIIMQKKELLKNSKDVRETDILLAELRTLGSMKS